MCTAVTYKTKDFYFGRTLDYEFLYESQVAVTPRNFPFPFRFQEEIKKHYGIVGMAHICEGYPLYYDGVNEKGLCMAGLNFVGNAVFREPCEDVVNLAQFELIPYILGTCATVKEATEHLREINITDTPFSKDLAASQLHWTVADREEAITLEAVAEGLKIYKNPVGVLTNNPTFPEQMFCLNNYRHLSARSAPNSFSKELSLWEYSRGMGAIGLPGDLSSQSRFVRAAFMKMNSVSGASEMDGLNQLFHILGTVEQIQGACELSEGVYEKTQYTCGCNASRGIYCYTTYSNHQITAVDMHRCNLEGNALCLFPLVTEEQINRVN